MLTDRSKLLFGVKEYKVEFKSSRVIYTELTRKRCRFQIVSQDIQRSHKIFVFFQRKKNFISTGLTNFADFFTFLNMSLFACL